MLKKYRGDTSGRQGFLTTVSRGNSIAFNIYVIVLPSKYWKHTENLGHKNLNYTIYPIRTNIVKYLMQKKDRELHLKCWRSKKQARIGDKLHISKAINGKGKRAFPSLE